MFIAHSANQVLYWHWILLPNPLYVTHEVQSWSKQLSQAENPQPAQGAPEEPIHKSSTPQKITGRRVNRINMAKHICLQPLSCNRMDALNL